MGVQVIVIGMERIIVKLQMCIFQPVPHAKSVLANASVFLRHHNPMERMNPCFCCDHIARQLNSNF